MLNFYVVGRETNNGTNYGINDGIKNSADWKEC
jgi:hypothetical protein